MSNMVFNTATEDLLHNCNGEIYAYIRVSTDHQDYKRQIDHVKQYGLDDDHIYGDKKSGRNFDRPKFQELMDRIKHLNAEGIAKFLAEIILSVFSLMAEIELDLIMRRMGDGLKQARLAGVKLGRKLKDIPEKFWNLKERFLDGKISQNKASRELEVDPKTFKTWVNRTGDASNEAEWEELKIQIEEQEKQERIEQAKADYGMTDEIDESDIAAPQEPESKSMDCDDSVEHETVSEPVYAMEKVNLTNFPEPSTSRDDDVAIATRDDSPTKNQSGESSRAVWKKSADKGARGSIGSVVSSRNNRSTGSPIRSISASIRKAIKGKLRRIL